MKFFITLEHEEDSGWWVVQCPSMPGCVSQGATREEAIENIKEAIALCWEVQIERGVPPMLETLEVEVPLP